MIRKLLLLVCVIAIGVLPALAQDAVTADEVNEIAGKLYCPVCENIPLDTCGTAACEDWRYEIQLQLEQGLTEEQIIDDFVVRFGDRVVGTPQDPVLRGLALITPWVLVGLSLLALLVKFATSREPQASAVPATPSNDALRTQLEQDLLS